MRTQDGAASSVIFDRDADCSMSQRQQRKDQQFAKSSEQMERKRTEILYAEKGKDVSLRNIKVRNNQTANEIL